MKLCKIPPMLNPVPTLADIKHEAYVRFNIPAQRQMFIWGGEWVLNEIKKREERGPFKIEIKEK